MGTRGLCQVFLFVTLLICTNCKQVTGHQSSSLDTYQQYLTDYQGAYGNNFHLVSSPYRYQQLRPAYQRPGAFSSRIRNLMNALFFRRDKKKAFYQPDYKFGNYKMALRPSSAVNAKPFYMSASSFKPQSIPYRQLQKYYKPQYGGGSNRHLHPQHIYSSGGAYTGVKGQGAAVPRPVYKVPTYQKAGQKPSHQKSGFRPVSSSTKVTVSSSSS